MPEETKNKFAITTRSGEVITLSKAVVQSYLTDNIQVTDAEFTQFFQLCKTYQVNPFLREAYIVKYGTQPATIVLDYKVLQQIADRHKAYKGMRHGIIVSKPDGTSEERHGEYLLPNETLLAGWCEVFRADRDEPTKVVAMFNEFKGTKKDGSLNSNWTTKPCFMIVKVAKAQALREAFPNLFDSNVYSIEEADAITSSNTPTNANAGKTSVSNRLVADDDGVVDFTSSEEEATTEDATTTD